MSNALPTDYQNFIATSRYARWLDDDRCAHPAAAACSGGWWSPLRARECSPATHSACGASERSVPHSQNTQAHTRPSE